MGFVGIAIGYGSGTIICAIYNCGIITYLIVTFSMVLIAVTSRKWKYSVQLTVVIYSIYAISFTIVIVVLNLNLDSAYKGLIQ